LIARLQVLRNTISCRRLRIEGVALQVGARSVVHYGERPSANALEESLLREYLLVELLDERVNRQFVAGRCRAAEGQISWIVPTERVTWQVSYLASHWGFHLRLLLFHFLAFKCIRLLCTLSLLFLSVVFTFDCCSFTFSLSNAFGFSALCPCSFSLSLSPPTVAELTERRLRSRSPSECIRLLGSLTYSLSVLFLVLYFVFDSTVLFV
jgi:hypothetical protein